MLGVINYNFKPIHVEKANKAVIAEKKERVGGWGTNFILRRT